MTRSYSLCPDASLTALSCEYCPAVQERAVKQGTRELHLLRKARTNLRHPAESTIAPGTLLHPGCIMGAEAHALDSATYVLTYVQAPA